MYPDQDKKKPADNQNIFHPQLWFLLQFSAVYKLQQGTIRLKKPIYSVF